MMRGERKKQTNMIMGLDAKRGCYNNVNKNGLKKKMVTLSCNKELEKLLPAPPILRSPHTHCCSSESFFFFKYAANL